jgi:hypothetical protein
MDVRMECHTGRIRALVRASDANGNVQPVDQQWNFGGYGNNGVQRVKCPRAVKSFYVTATCTGGAMPRQ